MTFPITRALYFRGVFTLYALALFTATHWPRLELPDAGVERTDLWVHVAAFALWTILLARSGFAGPHRARLTPLRAGLIALAYAALDEASQAIPWFHRHAALDDYLANALGVALGTILALALFTLRPRPLR